MGNFSSVSRVIFEVGKATFFKPPVESFFVVGLIGSPLTAAARAEAACIQSRPPCPYYFVQNLLVAVKAW
jgi:hypothetical protein